MSARRATITARLGTQARTVDGLTVNHGFVLDGGGIAGLDGSVTWADAAPVDVPALPTDAGWDRGPGEQLTIDWTDDQGTVRVATARLDGSSGDGLGGVSTDLTDWTSRLATTCEIRPTAAIMPRNLALPGSTHRRVWLDTTWLTAEAMRQAGFHPCQAMQRSAVAYHSMAGSAWPSPDRGTTAGTMGEVRQAYRLNDYGDVHLDASPSATQGDDTAVITNAYVLGVTRRRRNSTVPHWQMTQDLGVRKPDASDRGRCTVRPLRSSDGPGMRLDWDATSVRVQRVMPAGGTVTLGIYPRGESMRWSVVIRANGTATVYNDLLRDTPVAQLTSTGVTSLPTDSSEASYILEYPGRASAFQLSRSDSPFLVTQAVGAQIRRSTYAGRYVGAIDWVAPTEAGNFLALQARAEVGWRGIGLVQWIDEDGRLQNADFLALADGPVRHVLTTQSSGPDALDSASWSAPGTGPWRAVQVTARRPRVLRRDHPTLPLGEGSRETVARGDMLEQVIHPGTDQTWLHIDTSAYLAGHPYPAPTNKEFDNQWGTWVGGHRVDEGGQPQGWITVNDVTEWSLTASGEVRGALSVLDPRTVLVSGTVNTPVGLSMSTMPSPASSGLPEHRKSQPLAQIRGNGLVEWSMQDVEVEVSGDDRHQTYTHDGGMFLSNPAYQEYAAAEIAASLTDPVVLHTAQVAINPRVRVGDKVALRRTYATGWTRTVVGIVAQRRIDLPGRGDVMTLTVVGISDTKTPPTAPLPPPDPSPPTPAPPLPPGPGPDPDPPIDPADPPVVPPPPAPSAPAVTVDVNLLRIGWDGLDSTGASALGLNFGALEVAVSGSLVTPGDVVGRAELEGDGWHRLVHGPVPLDTTWYVRARILDVWGQEGPWSAPVVVQVDPLVDPQQFEDALARLLAAEDGLDELAADLANIGAALPDPEFTDPAQWDVPAGSTFRTDLTDHPYGRVTGLTIPAGANTTGAAATLPVEPGQRWWAAVLVRPEAASTSSVTSGLQVQWLRESGAHHSIEWVDARPLRDYRSGEWVLLSGYAVAPEDAAAVRFQVRQGSSFAPAWTVASARMLRASGGVADPVVLAGFIGALKIDVGQLVVTEGATINEAVILKLAGDLAEFIEVKAENILAGQITSLLRITAQGELVVGVESQVHVRIRDGRIDVMHPGDGDPYPYISMGRGADGAFRVLDGDGGVLGGVMPDGSVEGPEGRFESLIVAGSPLLDHVAPKVESLGLFATSGTVFGPSSTDMKLLEVSVDVPAGHTLSLDVRGHLRAASVGGQGLVRCFYTLSTDGSNPPRPEPSPGSVPEAGPHLPWPRTSTEWDPVMWRWDIAVGLDARIRALIFIQRNGTDFSATQWVVKPSIARVRGAAGFAGTIRATPGPTDPGTPEPNPPPPLVERTRQFALGPHSLWTGSTRWTSGYRLGDVQAGRGASGQVVETAILIPAAARTFIAQAEEVVSVRVRLAQSVYPTTIRPSIGTIQSTNITGTRAGLGIRNINPGSRTYTPSNPSGWTNLTGNTLAALMAGDPGLWVTHPTNGPAGRFHGPSAGSSARPHIEITTRSRT